MCHSRPGVGSNRAATGITVLVVMLAILLSLRAAIGPFNTPFGRIHSPIGLATVAGYGLAAVIALRLLPKRRAAEQAEPTWPLIGLVLLAGGALACLFLPALGDAHLSDDYILLLRAATEGSSVHQVWGAGGGDGSFRPVGAYYFHWLSAIAEFRPECWRMASLILHTLNAGLLFALCRKLWPGIPSLAFVSCSLFLIHGTRPEVVYWTAGSFDLIAGFFALLAIYWWVQSTAWPPIYGWLGSGVLLSLAILGKESAYATPFLGLALFLAAEKRWDKRIWSFAMLTLGVAGAFAIHRLLLFGGPGGYVDADSGRPQILSLNPLSTMKALVSRVWEVLYLPLNWEAGDSWPVGAAMVVYVAVLAFAGGRDARLSKSRFLFLALGVAISALPAIHLALVGENLLGSRVMYFPSILFSVLLASCLPAKGTCAKLCLVAVLGGQAIFLWHNLGAWRSASALADSICQEGTRGQGEIREIPAEVRGAFVFANGYSECLEMKRILANPAGRE